MVGIGGSATNDGGFGVARALGWKFLDRDGSAIERWTDLCSLTLIIAPKRRRWFQELIVAVDVQNPLPGIRGATQVYGPQKGLRRRDFKLAEGCLRRLAEVVAQQFGVPPSGGRGNRLKAELHTHPGAGAAGGLGFGLLAFSGARLEPGFDLFARLARLDQRLRSADLVITGEGCIDPSTLMGKGVGQNGAALSFAENSVPRFGRHDFSTRQSSTRLHTSSRADRIDLAFKCAGKTGALAGAVGGESGVGVQTLVCSGDV